MSASYTLGLCAGFSCQTVFTMLGAKFITQTDASIIDVSWWRLVLCPIHHSSSDTVSLCGSKVTGFTATPFFFCFVCEHSEGPCQGQAPDCWADYHRFTSRTEKKVFPVVFCFVPPPLHWGQMLWKWSSNRALGMTEWCRELDLQNLMTFDSCINRKQKVQLSVLFTWKRIQGGRAWWCKCFARICG